MAVVLLAMGGYGSYLGWQIRTSDDGVSDTGSLLVQPDVSLAAAPAPAAEIQVAVWYGMWSCAAWYAALAAARGGRSAAQRLGGDAMGAHVHACKMEPLQHRHRALHLRTVRRACSSGNSSCN
jgi:hypothetical protein